MLRKFVIFPIMFVIKASKREAKDIKRTFKLISRKQTENAMAKKKEKKDQKTKRQTTVYKTQHRKTKN